MRSIATFLVGIIAATCALGVPLSIGATHDFIRQGQIPKEPENDEITITIELLFTNVSDRDITLPTAVTEPNLLFGDGRVCFEFSFREKKDGKGRVMVPALDQFSPVTLRPGESTHLVYQKNISPKYLRGLKIVVRYSSSEFLRDRFKLWSGKLEVDSKLKGGGALLDSNQSSTAQRP